MLSIYAQTNIQKKTSSESQSSQAVFCNQKQPSLTIHITVIQFLKKLDKRHVNLTQKNSDSWRRLIL